MASANEVYDDEARKKLLAKINRVAENLGIDENFAAAVRAHLKATGQIRGDQPAGTEGQGAGLAEAPEFMGEASEPTPDLGGGSPRAPDFFTPTGRNPLEKTQIKNKNKRSLFGVNYTRACLQLREERKESEAERLVFWLGEGFPNQRMSNS